MAAYSSEAYDFSLFETDGSAARAAAAPILPEQPESPKSSVKAVPQKKEAQLRPAVKALVAVFLSVLVVAGCGILLNRRAKIDSLAAEIRDMKENISLEESDNVRLSRELDKLFSRSAVESYAENVLGMVKIDTYNTIQISIPKTDGVLVSGGKETQQAQQPVLPSAPVYPGAETPAQTSEASDETPAQQTAEG